MSVEGWKTKPLSAISEIVMGQSPDSKYYSEEEIGFPFLQGCAEFTNKYPLPKLYCSQSKKIATSGSILFSVRAPVGKTNRADRDYIIGRGLSALSAFGIFQDYLHHYLIHVENDFRNASQGSTFEAINSKELNNWSVSFPELLEEQTKIAAILSTIDRAIEQTEAIIAKQQRIKTGLMQDLLTKGIDEDGNVRSEETHEFKDSAIGRIPVEWQICSLGEKARIRSGSTPSRANQKFWVEGTYPWVKTAEVNFSEITETEEKITELALYCCALNLEPTGTLLVAMYGQGKTRGRSAILGIDATTNQACAAIFGNKEICQKYLFYYFSFQYDEIRNIGHGSNQTNLNGRLLADFLIKLPSHKEQFKIAEILIQIDRQIYQRQTTFMKLQKTKQGLMQDLLTGKVRVTELLRDRAEASP